MKVSDLNVALASYFKQPGAQQTDGDAADLVAAAKFAAAELKQPVTIADVRGALKDRALFLLLGGEDRREPVASAEPLVGTNTPWSAAAMARALSAKPKSDLAPEARRFSEARSAVAQAVQHGHVPADRATALANELLAGLKDLGAHYTEDARALKSQDQHNRDHKLHVGERTHNEGTLRLYQSTASLAMQGIEHLGKCGLPRAEFERIHALTLVEMAHVEADILGHAVL